MEQKYKAFSQYDWRNSSDWQLYYENLTPKPPGNRIEHWKKKFYKLKVDEDFDIKWEAPAIPQSNPSRPTSTSQNFNYPSANPPFTTGSTLDIIFAGLECGMWLYFFVSLFLVRHQILKILCLALVIRTFRRVGYPKFKMEFAQNLFLDEHFQLLLYSCLLFIDRINYFVLVPQMITAVLNIADFFKTYLKITVFDFVFRKRVELAKVRANLEIAVGFFLILGVFIGLNTFILPIFFWQYMRFKYIVNKDIESSFYRLNEYVNKFKSNPSCPSPVRFVIDKVQQFCSYLTRTEAAPGQAAGGQNCAIF